MKACSPTLESWGDAFVSLTSFDDIQVYWEVLQYTSRYRRYNGRDIASETTPREREGGVRIPISWG